MENLRWALVFLLLPALVGCATAAQREVRRTSEVITQAKSENKACVEAVTSKPEYAPLLSHMAGSDTGQYTMAQLTDETVPTPDDARLLAAETDDVDRCVHTFIGAVATVRPDTTATYSNEIAAADQVVARLVERKITWAEGARESEAVKSQVRAKLAELDRRWRSEMKSEHRAELARRQAAANALLQYSAEQRLISAASRPVIVQPSVVRPVVTNCNRVGTFVNCTSY